MTENREYNVEFGKLITERRKIKGLSQKVIAERLGISQSYYSMLEHAKRPHDFAMALKICEILEIDPREFDFTAAIKSETLIEKAIEAKTEIPFGEMLTGKIAAEKKSEGKSVSLYLTTDALKNLEKFAKTNGCSNSKAADLILRNLY